MYWVAKYKRNLNRLCFYFLNISYFLKLNVKRNSQQSTIFAKKNHLPSHFYNHLQFFIPTSLSLPFIPYFHSDINIYVLRNNLKFMSKCEEIYYFDFLNIFENTFASLEKHWIVIEVLLCIIMSVISISLVPSVLPIIVVD